MDGNAPARGPTPLLLQQPRPHRSCRRHCLRCLDLQAAAPAQSLPAPLDRALQLALRLAPSRRLRTTQLPKELRLDSQEEEEEEEEEVVVVVAAAAAAAAVVGGRGHIPRPAAHVSQRALTTRVQCELRHRQAA